jgi:DNA replication and repair protein RecF
MLLDDVMSELDGARRARLARALASHGQSVVTTTELEHVPGYERSAAAQIAVADVQRTPSPAVAP